MTAWPPGIEFPYRVHPQLGRRDRRVHVLAIPTQYHRKWVVRVPQPKHWRLTALAVHLEQLIQQRGLAGRRDEPVRTDHRHLEEGVGPSEGVGFAGQFPERLVRVDPVIADAVRLRP